MYKESEYEIRANFSEALERFDFSRVYDVMNYLNWYWGGNNRPPSLIEMIKTVKEELFEYAIELFKGKEVTVFSGGFLVKIFKNRNVEIQFIVEESYSYD